jgi:hypothetical protein
MADKSQLRIIRANLAAAKSTERCRLLGRRIGDLVGFHEKPLRFFSWNWCGRMAAIRAIFTFGVTNEWSHLRIICAELAVTTRRSVVVFFAIESRILVVLKRISEHIHQIAFGRMGGIRPKMTLGGMFPASLFSVLALSSLPQPETTESTTPWLSNCGFGGPQKEFLLVPSNNQPR